MKLIFCSIDDAKDNYSRLCLMEAEKAVNEANFQINLANKLIEESHRFDLK